MPGPDPVPGTYRWVDGRDPVAVVEARRRGESIRDTVLVIDPDGLHPHVLTRTPLDGTLCDTVVRHGSGVLAIDTCRVGYAGEADRDGAFPGGAVTSRKVSGGGLGCGWKEHSRGSFEAARPPGRWPANLVLVHSSGCASLGRMSVVASSPPGPAIGVRSGGVFSASRGWAAGNGGRVFHGSPDGTEEVPAWECAPGCPVSVLDGQGGFRRNGGQNATSDRSKHGPIYGDYGPDGGTTRFAGDAGMASRFFPQFPDGAGSARWLGSLISGGPRHVPGKEDPDGDRQTGVLEG